MAATLPTTAAEAETLLLENSNYSEGDGNLAAADQFIVAARAWLILNPQKAIHGGRGGEEIHLNVEQVEEMLKQALQWTEAYRAEGSTKFYDFTSYKT